MFIQDNAFGKMSSVYWQFCLDFNVFKQGIQQSNKVGGNEISFASTWRKELSHVYSRRVYQSENVWLMVINIWNMYLNET